MTKETDIFITGGHIFKTLIELLNSNISKASIYITNTGLYISEINGDNTILIIANMPAENFKRYIIPKHVDKKNCITTGITLAHVKALLNPIKKKDNLEIYIDSEFPDMLTFSILSNSNNNPSVNSVKIIDITENEIQPPKGYRDIPCCHIASGEFQSLCKTLKTLSVVSTRIRAQDNGIEISGNKAGLYSTKTPHGVWDEAKEVIYDEEFPTKLLLKIAKIASLGKTIKVFCSSKKDTIKFKTNLGTLGEVEIYMNPPKNSK